MPRKSLECTLLWLGEQCILYPYKYANWWLCCVTFMNLQHHWRGHILNFHPEARELNRQRVPSLPKARVLWHQGELPVLDKCRCGNDKVSIDTMMYSTYCYPMASNILIGQRTPCYYIPFHCYQIDDKILASCKCPIMLTLLEFGGICPPAWWDIIPETEDTCSSIVYLLAVQLKERKCTPASRQGHVFQGLCECDRAPS